MELSGKSPFIVFEDVDLDIVEGIVDALGLIRDRFVVLVQDYLSRKV